MQGGALGPVSVGTGLVRHKSISDTLFKCGFGLTPNLQSDILLIVSASVTFIVTPTIMNMQYPGKQIAVSCVKAMPSVGRPSPPASRYKPHYLIFIMRIAPGGCTAMKRNYGSL